MAVASIRKQLRNQRRSLGTAQQIILSEKITSILTRQNFFLRAKRVGIYLANDGEIDPSKIIHICLKSSKKCFLPVIHPLKINRLHFASYNDHSQLIVNRFEIMEPRLTYSKIAPTWSLDVIFMPLVGFDRRGNRLGMGGGFYDRTLALFTQQGRRVTALGLAYDSQLVPHPLPVEPTDIGLNAVITPTTVYEPLDTV